MQSTCTYFVQLIVLFVDDEYWYYINFSDYVE